MIVGIYGLGRFGTFWGTCLARHVDVIGYSRSPKELSGTGIRQVSMNELVDVDALFLCVAISAVSGVLDELGPRVKRGTVVIDTCSVKIEPVRWMQERLPDYCQIIATHPMFGPDSGKNGITGLPLVYWPVRTEKETATYWHGLFSEMGLDVLSLSPEEHDRAAAYTQGVTHFIGRILREMDLKPNAIATLGYRKLLEIVEQTCNDPLQLFIDLQRFNPYTRDMRSELYDSIKKTMALLDSST